MGTLQSELIKHGLAKDKNKKSNRQKKSNKRKKRKSKQQKKRPIENLSRRDWEEIMGVNMPKFKRNRGAFRQI